MTSPTSSTDLSRAVTPQRFTSQAATAEDLLKSQTVGLVHLSDFRKRRAEALEQKEREATGSHGGRFAPASSTSGAATPNSLSDGVSTPQEQRPKKRKKPVAKGKLSFDVDDEEESHTNGTPATTRSDASDPDRQDPSMLSPATAQEEPPKTEKKRLRPNASVSFAPKTLTKSAILKEAQAREQLRKDFLLMQEAVKATEIVIPFVFYDGTNIPGGACKVKKGDHAWLFLDRSRKVGAELGVGGGEKSNSRKEWARIGVDDLLLVRGEVIIPHHYEIYHFIVNRTLGPNGKALFGYASTMDTAAAAEVLKPEEEDEGYVPVSSLEKRKVKNSGQVTEADRGLEGIDDDPNFTKVVDRRWYERNKHIFPASVWEEYDPGKDYVKGVRKDAQGNAFFFS